MLFCFINRAPTHVYTHANPVARHDALRISLALWSRRIVYLEGGDWAVVSRSGGQVFRDAGVPVGRPEQVSTVSAALVGKGNYRHFMEKEIHEQPEAIAHTLHAVLDPGTGTARIPAPLDAADVPKITIVAAGTSYYAGLAARRSEEHTSELQSLMRISYAVFCLKKKN